VKNVSQTRRNIEFCFKEHIRNINNQKTNKSSLAEHVLESNHSINLIQLLKQVTSNQEVIISKAIEMSKIKTIY